MLCKPGADNKSGNQLNAPQSHGRNRVKSGQAYVRADDVQMELGLGDSCYFYLSAPHGNSWVGVGFGKGMKDSFMLIAYTSEDGTNLTLSPRLSSDHVEPTHNKDTATSIVLSESRISDGRYLAVGMCRNCRSASIDRGSTEQPMIYAVGPDDLHLNSDAQDAGLRKHTYWGSFQIDLRAARGDPALFPPKELITSNATAIGGEHNNHEYTSSLHAAAMAGTFVLIFPIGAFYKMVMRNVRWHWITQTLGLVIVLIGAGLGLGMSHYYNRSKHFNSTHQIIGLVVVVLVILQASLGSLHHRIFKAQQRATIMGMIHRFLGLAVICLGVINGVSGFELASASHHHRAYAIAIALVIVILFGLGVLLTRRRRRQEAFNSTPAQNFRNAYHGPDDGIPLQPSYGPPPAYGRPMG
ncbi:MAG: hypothetical protein Q9169_004103 [Polycauliona sp. 2 TL-2023]